MSERFGWKPRREIKDEPVPTHEGSLGMIHCLVRLHDGVNSPAFRKDVFQNGQWGQGDSGANKLTHYIVIDDIPFLESENGEAEVLEEGAGGIKSKA